MRLALVLCLVLTASVAHGADPTLEWRTLESAHFIIHYYEPNRDIAQRVAEVAERAHDVLTPVMRYAPPGKTHILLTDDTDGSNGYATVLPRNTIGLYATAPTALSTLNDHDDWLYALVAHEYAHILHLDTMGPLQRWYNRFAGKQWAPNGVQPRWLIEGLATYQESKRTSGGRRRNAIFDMWLRVPVLAGDPIELDQVSSGGLIFPHGNIAYLYGAWFLGWIADRYGDRVIADLSHDYGSSAAPWGLNRSLVRAIGRGYTDLYDEWLEHLRQRYRLQRAAVVARGQIEGRRVTRSGEGNDSPRYHPDGKRLIWERNDGHSRPQYRALAPGADERASERYALIEGAGQFGFLPDGSGVVIERGQNYRTYYGYTDLWRWDASSGELTRLTHGERAATPDVSPDGRRVAFVRNARTQRTLAIAEMTPNAPIEDIWKGGRWDQAYHPAWSPDGKKIAFSAWIQGGWHDLYVYDLETRKTTRLTEDRAVDTLPRWSPDGRWLLFTSDRTGIYNIYAVDPAQPESLRQVTNVIGGAFAFDVSPDSKHLAYIGFTTKGYDLYEMPYQPERWLDAEVYVDDRPDPTVVRAGYADTTPPRRYRSLDTLGPLTYQLQATVDSFGTAFALQTSGRDVVGKDSWFLGVVYGLERGDLGFGAFYSTSRWWPALSLSLSHGIGQAGGLIVDQRNTAYTEESWGIGTSVTLPVLRAPELFGDLSVSYDASWIRNVDDLPMPDPHTAVTRLPITGVVTNLTVRWSMSDLARFGLTLGPVEGKALAFGIRLSEPALGSSAQAFEAFWSASTAVGLPWWRHTAALRYSGAVVNTDYGRAGDYGLGGLPRQDLVTALRNSTRVGTSGYLRGYAPGTVRGRQYHLVNAEYRIPVRLLEKGLETLPAFVRRLHLAGLLDAGTAFHGEFDLGNVKVAAGAAVRLDLTVGYFVGGTLELGWARGLSEDGKSELWLLLTDGI